MINLLLNKKLPIGLIFLFLGLNAFSQDVLFGPDDFDGGTLIGSTISTDTADWNINSGSWSVSTSNQSSGYTGASGGNNLRINLSGGSGVITLNRPTAISTVNYDNITVKFGVSGTSINSFTGLDIFYGDGAVSTSSPQVNAFNIFSSFAWYEQSVAIPASNFNDLRLLIRVNTFSGGSIHIDDFKVEGTAASFNNYTNVGSDLSDLNNWEDNLGDHPASFSDPNNIYTVVTAGSTITTNWSVSGSNSQVIVSSGSDFTIPSAYTYTGNAIEVEDNATLFIENSSTIPTLTNLGTNSTVNFSGGSQDVPNYSYGNLEVSGTGTKSISSSITISGNLILTAGVLELIQTDDQTVTINGNITRTSGSLSGSVNSNLTLGGTSNVSSLYFSGNTNLRNLTINKSSATVNLQSDLTVNNNLSLQSGTFNLNSGSLTVESGFSSTSSGNIAGTSSSSLTLNGSGNLSLEFASGSQILNNLTINRASSTITMESNLEVAGALTLSDGSFDVNNYLLRLSGDPISGTPANLVTTSSSNLSFTGAATSVFIPASVSQLNNLTLDNINGLQQNSSSLTINGTMTLTDGELNIQSNELYLLSSPSLSSGTLDASSGTVYYNQPTNNQNIIAGTYANLVSNNNVKQFPNGLVNITGTFTPGTASHNMATGEVEFSGTGAQTVPDLAYHDLTFSDLGDRNMSSASVSGDFITNGNTVTISGTIEYDGTTSQTIAALDYNDLIISNNKNNGTLTLASGNISVSGAFTNNATGISAYATSGNTFIYNGSASQTITPFNYNNLTITGSRTSATITLGSGTIRLAGDFTNDATGIIDYTVTGNTFEYNGTTTQSVATLEYNNLTINNAAGCNLTGDVTLDGTLALTAGVLNIDTYTLRLLSNTSIGSGSIASSNTGTVEFAQATDGQTVLLGSYGNLTTEGGSKIFSAGTVNIANTFTTNAVAHSFSSSGAGSTINFNGAGTTQAVPSENYFNLSLTNGGTYDFSGTIGIAGNFTISGTNTYNTSGSTFNFNGSGNQDVAGIQYDNLTVTDRSGTVTLIGTMSISGVFSAATATTIYNPATSVVNFNGTVAQNIPDIDFYDLTISNSAGVALTGDIVVNRFLNLSAGSLSIGDNILTINNDITYSSGSLTGNLTGAILNLNGSANTSLAAIDLYQLNVDRSGNTITLTGGLNVANQLQISNGTLSAGSNNVSVANSLINNGSFDTGTSTVTFTSATVISGSNNITFNNVITNGTLSSITGTNSPIYVNGNWTNNSTDNASIGVTVHFSGSGAQTLQTNNANPSIQSFSNVIFEGTGTKTLASNFDVNGNVDLSGGTLDVADFTINLTGNWLNSGATFTPGNGTVILDGDIGQDITTNGESFNNLIMTPTSPESISLLDEIDINGNLTANDGATLVTNDNNIVIAGNWIFNTGSTFTSGTETVNFDGTTTQTISTNGNAFNTVIFSGSGDKSLLSGFTANNDVTIEAGATFNSDIYTANILADLINSGTVNVGNAGSGLLDVAGNLDNTSSIAANADINLAGNWNNTGTFTPNQYAVNLDGATTQTITGGNFHDLTMSGGGSRVLLSDLDIDNDLTIGSGIAFTNYDGAATWYDISLAGDWINDGSFTATDGTLLTDGTALQEIRGSSTTTLFDLTTNNTSADGVRIEGEVDLVNTLKLQANTNFDADGASNSGILQLLSNTSRTARIAKVEAGATLNGEVTTAHTLVKSSVGWFNLGTPVKSQTVAEWIDDMRIQGVDTRLPSAYPTVNLYNQSTGEFEAVTNASTVINPGQGVQLLLFSSNFTSGSMTYDNRGLSVVGNSTDQTNTAGTEAFDFTLSYTDRAGVSASDEGWNLISNPYPSEISMNAANWTMNSSVNGMIYVWDGANYSYTTYDMSTTSASIASGQGFFVHAIGASPEMSVNEDAKNADNPSFFRQTEPENELIIFAQNQTGRKDKAVLRFRPNASKGFDLNLDAYKLNGSQFNLATTLPEGQPMVFNTLPALAQDDSVAIKFTGIKGKYTLTFDQLITFNNKASIYLKDNYSNVTVPVNEVLEYEFEVNDEEASQGNNRFQLLFIRNFVNLGGIIKNAQSEIIPAVELAIENQAGQKLIANSNDSGAYQLEVERWKSFSIKPSLTRFNATSFKDILLSHLHNLGKVNISAPYMKIAADVNGDMNLNNEDVTAMIDNYFYQSDYSAGNWTFIHDDSFDPDNIWPLPTSAFIQSDVAKEVHFTGIPLGKYDEGYFNSKLSASDQALFITTDPNYAISGDILNLPLMVKPVNDIMGFHFILSWDPKQLALLEYIEGIENLHINAELLDKGKLQLMYLNQEDNGLTVAELMQLIKLRFEVLANTGEEILLSLDSQEAIAVDNSNTLSTVNLIASAINVGEKNNAFEVLQNYPNPAREETRVVFSLPEAGEVELMVLDINGKIILNNEAYFESGVNYFDLNLNKIPSGTYLYNVKYNEEVVGKKLIIR